MHITLNSQTDPKHHLESRGGREFLVTKMSPITGDSVMNGLLYPMPVVANAYSQLDKLPAPAGHPQFDGQAVSALDPEGASAYSIGAFVRNPVLNGEQVLADLVIDTEVAGRTDNGRKVIERIQNGDRIGVSTGLNGQIDNKSGFARGQEFQGVLNSIRFDHVALLLDAPPAGNTFTLNQQELSMRTVEINTEALSLEDHTILLNAARHPGQLVEAITVEATPEVAERIVTNAGKFVMGEKPRDYESFIENRDHLAQWKKTMEAARKEKLDFITENSEMAADDLAALNDDALDNLIGSIKPKNIHIANFRTGGQTEELDLSALEA